ncbi:MAG: hypothetical protein R3A44_10775 [Caldilineaceae bacterium]
MQNLTALKNKGQESIANLIEQGKQQPDEVKVWGVTAAAGLGGAVALAAAAKGILAIVSTVANPAVALTMGAVGGGALGWSWMQKQGMESDAQGTGIDQGLAEARVEAAAVAEAITEATDIENSQDRA